MAKRIHTKTGVKTQIRYPFAPDWSSKTLHGYRFSGNRSRRELWISTDMHETIPDETGVWFDGPLLSGKQVLDLATELNRWVRMMKEPEPSGRQSFSNSLVRLDTVADELAVLCLCRTNTTISDDISEFRGLAPITPRRAALLVKELRKLGRELLKNEEEQ